MQDNFTKILGYLIGAIGESDSTSKPSTSTPLVPVSFCIPQPLSHANHRYMYQYTQCVLIHMYLSPRRKLQCCTSIIESRTSNNDHHVLLVIVYLGNLSICTEKIVCIWNSQPEGVENCILISVLSFHNVLSYFSYHSVQKQLCKLKSLPVFIIRQAFLRTATKTILYVYAQYNGCHREFLHFRLPEIASDAFSGTTSMLFLKYFVHACTCT